MTHTPDVPGRDDAARNRPGRDGAEAPAPAPVLARAAAALREHVDPGWVDARDRIRSAALAATRRTWPLALREEAGLYVSDQVIITLLRETIDAVDHVRASAVFITPRDDLVDLVTVEIAVDYPHPIRPLTDEVRRRSTALVRDLLAPRPDGPNPPVDIEVTSVVQA